MVFMSLTHFFFKIAFHCLKEVFNQTKCKTNPKIYFTKGPGMGKFFLLKQNYQADESGNGGETQVNKEEGGQLPLPSQPT